MLEFFTKRDIYRQGVWCIKDMETPEYEELARVSQMTVDYDYEEGFGLYVVYFIVVLIFVFMLKRCVCFFVDKSESTNTKNAPVSNFLLLMYYKIAAINRYISYRRIPSNICYFLGVPSNLGNFVIITICCLYMLLYSFIPHFYYRACIGFGSPPLAIRTGMMSAALIPFIIVLSGKVNLISQLTGISYEKVNVYHRWSSIFCCFLAWVHAIPFYIQALQEGGRDRLVYMQNTDSSYVHGIPPLIFLTWLCLLSHPMIRGLNYEFFMQTHWIAAVCFFISIWVHVSDNSVGHSYIIATLVLWVTQLIARAAMRCSFNKKFMRAQPALLSRFSGDEKCLQVIITKPQGFTWRSGQHLFLRTKDCRFIENHPFSIANSLDEENQIKLIVKPRNGITKMLYEATPEDGSSINKNLFLDGPYGGLERDIKSFSNVFLLATGSGISAIIPFLSDIQSKMMQEPCSIEHVSLHWIMRNEDCTKWVEEQLSPYKKLMSRFSINLYAKESPFTPTDSIDEKEYNCDIRTISKPNVDEIMKSVSDQLGQKNIIITSGSSSFVNKIGNDVAGLQTNVLRNSNVKEIYLHTESFDW